MRNVTHGELAVIMSNIADASLQIQKQNDRIEKIMDSLVDQNKGPASPITIETIREAAAQHPAEQSIQQAMAAIDNGKGVHPSQMPDLGDEAPVETDWALGLGKTADGIPRRFLHWGKRVSVEFLDKVLWIERDLGLNANNLMNCMAFETGRTFSPKVKNPGSSATGLIQFMRATALRLGTTVEQLADMTAENQLNYVWKYFEDYAGRMDLSKWNLGDTYMSILWPAGVGKPDSHPIFVQGRGNTYAANRGLDANRDGTVTRGECIAKIMQMQKEGSQPLNWGYGIL